MQENYRVSANHLLIRTITKTVADMPLSIPRQEKCGLTVEAVAARLLIDVLCRQILETKVPGTEMDPNTIQSED